MSRIVQSNYNGSVFYGTRTVVPEPHVYCPVCRIDYPQSQTDAHILRHTIQNLKYEDKK